VNGVCRGTVKAAPALTVGAVLPVAVMTGQELPVAPVENATIWSKLRVWKVSSLCGWRFSAPQMPA
jgi:hypothetical protein